MLTNLIDWIILHWVEITGAVTGIVYLVFSIRQNILVWPLSLVSSLMYIIVFFHSSVYANMILQGYFFLMGVYGWYFWRTGKKSKQGKPRAVSRIKTGHALFLGLFFAGIFPLVFLLLKHTDSPVPVADSFTTTLSIIATWLMARKILEHWILWIIVDIVSVGMYLHLGLLLTTILYGTYVLMAFKGLWEWKKTVPGNSGEL